MMTTDSLDYILEGKGGTVRTNAQAVGEELAEVWNVERAERILRQIDRMDDARWFAKISVIVERYMLDGGISFP